MTQSKVFILEEDDFASSVFGHYWIITSSLPDHKIVYRINRALSANFKRTRLDHLSARKGLIFCHPTFVWNDPQRDHDWVLLSNRGVAKEGDEEKLSLFSDPARNNLIPASDRADYILVGRKDLEREETGLSKVLRKVPGIERISAYKPSQNSVKDALIIELENYL